MKRSSEVVALAAVCASAAFLPCIADACTVSIANGSVYSSIAQAVAAADHISDTLTVTGTCNENVLVDNTHLRMIIQGGAGGATINAPAGAPGLDLRVKGVLVQSLTVTGGSRGIVIQRNANAIIQNVVVENTGGDGIDVDSMAFAVILASTIQNNPQTGIAVAALGSARIGINFFEDGATNYQGNLIQSNKTGILVLANGVAQIYANNISGNKKNGIEVWASSSASTGGNTISSNGRSGILTAANASILIGSSPNFNGMDPDQSPTPNARYGIECGAGSAILVASLGTLNGSLGQFLQDGTCPGGISNVIP